MESGISVTNLLKCVMALSSCPEAMSASTLCKPRVSRPRDSLRFRVCRTARSRKLVEGDAGREADVTATDAATEVAVVSAGIAPVVTGEVTAKESVERTGVVLVDTLRNRTPFLAPLWQRTPYRNRFSVLPLQKHGTLYHPNSGVARQTLCSSLLRHFAVDGRGGWVCRYPLASGWLLSSGCAFYRDDALHHLFALPV